MTITKQDIRTTEAQADDAIDAANAAERAAEKATAAGNAREAAKQTDLAATYRRMAGEFAVKAVELKAKLEVQRAKKNAASRARADVYRSLGMVRARNGMWE